MTDTIIDTIQLNFDSDSQWVLNIALAFVMFGIALEISVNDFKTVFRTPKSILVGVFSQFIMLPAITFLLVLVLKPSPSMALGMFLVAACPGGNVSNFMTHLAKGNTALSVSLTAFATVLSILMTPLNLQILGSNYAPTAKLLHTISVSPIDMLLIVALLLGIPLVIGMFLHNKLPNLAKKMARVFKTISLIFFVVLIFIALYNNKVIFLKYVVYVFWIVLVHNILAYLTGFLIAKFASLSKRDLRSITIETGIQNSGLGLILVFTFFDGLGGMALITAFWGIWHLVSGLFLASYWNRQSVN